MADKDRQSSPSFSQSAAGGVMSRVVKLWSLLPWEGTIVQMSRAIMSFLSVKFYIFTFFFLKSRQNLCNQPDLWCICILCLICSPFSTSIFRLLHTYIYHDWANTPTLLWYHRTSPYVHFWPVRAVKCEREVKCTGPTVIKCAENNNKSWSNGWCQGITASPLVLHGFMRVWLLYCEGVACSHRSQPWAHRTCYSADICIKQKSQRSQPHVCSTFGHVKKM